MKKRQFKWIGLLMGIIILTFVVPHLGVEAATNIDYGADIGYLSQLENSGVKYVNESGTEQDALQILKSKGVDTVRIRAFVNPNFTQGVTVCFHWTSAVPSACGSGSP